MPFRIYLLDADGEIQSVFHSTTDRKAPEAFGYKAGPELISSIRSKIVYKPLMPIHSTSHR